jgi:hypothetical protein
MSVSLVHYGVDECLRVPVLQYAGFDVAECDSFSDLEQILRGQHVDAVVFAELPAEVLIGDVHRISEALLVCFTSGTFAYEYQLDLVIARPARPEEWLVSIGNLLEKSSGLRLQYQAARIEADGLRAESAAVRERTRRLIEAMKGKKQNG